MTTKRPLEAHIRSEPVADIAYLTKFRGMDTSNCIPKDKHDTAAIERASLKSFPSIIPILPDLLVWVQDANWPVAASTASLLSNAGPEILPHIKAILNSEDSTWKYWTIELVVRNLSSVVQAELRDDLVKLAKHPTKSDRLEGVDRVTQSIMES